MYTFTQYNYTETENAHTYYETTENTTLYQKYGMSEILYCRKIKLQKN